MKHGDGSGSQAIIEVTKIHQHEFQCNVRIEEHEFQRVRQFESQTFVDDNFNPIAQPRGLISLDCSVSNTAKAKTYGLVKSKKRARHRLRWPGRSRSYCRRS